MQERTWHLKQWAIIVLILFWLGWHLALPVDFVGADLGRHIKNGELILQGHWDVLYKNFYSYTNPDYPFINHHWLFGVFCYALWHWFGLTGLSFIYLLLEVFTFYVFFCCWRRYSSFPIACAFALLSFPLITLRYEIRPEGVSYLFCGLFWWMIDSFQQKRLKPRYLFIGLCALQVIWVNSHIFFIMGPILTAIFWLQAQINKEKEQASVLQKLFFLLLVMCLINPSGINGFLVPFYMHKAYSFPIIENLSVSDVLKAKIMFLKPVILYFLASLLMLGAVLFFLIRREGFKGYVFIGILALLSFLAAMKANRMIGLYGFLWIPLSVHVFGRWLQYAGTDRARKNIEIALVVLGIIVSASVNCDWKQSRYLGIFPGANDAADFFKREKISGPIFNDYDIGGYLIFHLSPQYQFFVDNRMEAFPKDFIIMSTYAPSHWNEGVWHDLDQKYHFNVIFMSLQPFNYWETGFIVHRLEDSSWALVFLNSETIIFLKRNEQNARLIKRDEILADGIVVNKQSNSAAPMFKLIFKGVTVRR